MRAIYAPLPVRVHLGKGHLAKPGRDESPVVQNELTQQVLTWLSSKGLLSGLALSWRLGTWTSRGFPVLEIVRMAHCLSCINTMDDTEHFPSSWESETLGLCYAEGVYVTNAQ